MALSKMPPPGAKKPALVIAVGAGKPPGMDDGPKPPANPADPTDPDDDGDDDSKMSPDKALIVRGNQHCSDCANYHAEDGSCEEVEGQFSPDDACFCCFKPMADDEDMGGAPESAPPADDQMPQGLGRSS